MIKFPIQSCYLAAPDFEKLVANGLQGETVRFGRLFINSNPPDRRMVWAHNIWQSPLLTPVSSISSASKILRSIQRNWAPFYQDHCRRMALIQEQLPKIPSGPQAFPLTMPTAPMGAWTLLEPGLMLHSADCSSPYPNGEIEFIEDKLGPPNRAYLKIWEALALCGALPDRNDTCLELGASPGGWTWVLGQYAGKVYAIDRAPLDPRVAAQKSIEFRAGNAFSATPRDYPDVTWLISDLICYPDKLLEFIQPWLDAPALKRMILTIKFQGQDTYGILDRFHQIAGSSIRHLRSNKHEVTFFWQRPS